MIEGVDPKTSHDPECVGAPGEFLSISGRFSFARINGRTR
jgi:hypothetical protein